MKYIKLFEDFNPSDIPQTEPQFTLWMMQNAPKAVLNPQEWFESEISKPEPDWVFISSIIKELDLLNRLSIPERDKKNLEKIGFDKYFIESFPLLHWAVDENNTGLTKMLIERGADLNAQDDFKRTPLHWAALRGHTQIGKILIEEGANLDMRDDHNRTPLHWASWYRYPAIAEVLIDAGAKLNLKDYRDETPWDVTDDDFRQILPELNPNKESL